MKKFNLTDWAFSTLLVGNVLNLFTTSSNDVALAIAPAIAGALIMTGGSILGGMFGRKSPPVDPNARFYGMAAEQSYGYAQNLVENPYGFGDEAKRGMRNIARDTFSSGQQGLDRQREARFGATGLSQAGGTMARQDYYSANQFSEGLNTAYNQIEVGDARLKDAQRARGENIMLSLANKNPFYSQLSSQNYWNSLQEQDQFTQGLGQSLGSLYQSYLDRGQQSPYGAQTGSGTGTISDYDRYLTNNTSNSGYGNFGSGNEDSVTSVNPYGYSAGR